MQFTYTDLIQSVASLVDVYPGLLLEDEGFVEMLKVLLKTEASWESCIESLGAYVAENM